jgi:hypothetical protein
MASRTCSHCFFLSGYHNRSAVDTAYKAVNLVTSCCSPADRNQISEGFGDFKRSRGYASVTERGGEGKPSKGEVEKDRAFRPHWADGTVFFAFDIYLTMSFEQAFCAY